MLTDREKFIVRNTALQTLRDAYSGFNVHFTDEPSGERLIKVEDAPYRSYGPGSVVAPDTVGGTYPVAKVSSVYPDALYAIELAVARCQDIIGCHRKTRQQLVEGLGVESVSYAGRSRPSRGAALAIPLSSLRRCRSDPLRTRSLIAAIPRLDCGDSPMTDFRRSVISVYTIH
jgi:hypothetical protein